MKKTTYQQPATQLVRLQHKQMLMEPSATTVPGNQITSHKPGYESKQPTSDWD